MSARDINFFFHLLNQLKLHHWQTTHYARHKALDDAIDALQSHVDKYVEVYIGKYGRPKLTSASNTIEMGNLSEKVIVDFVANSTKYLNKELTFKPTDNDLANVRDEMVAELHKLLYLFTLN